jgi:hypothetical protein
MEEFTMMKTLLAVCVVVILPLLALGQEEDQASQGIGYAFVAPGAIVSEGSSSGLLHFGGGAEGRLYKGLGFAAEIGYLAPFRELNQGVGVFSLDGIYRFHKSKSKIEPFLAGGYSVFFRRGTAHGANLGGGIDYWFLKKLGLRLEFRDYFQMNYPGDHLIQGRVGFAFR